MTNLQFKLKKTTQALHFFARQSGGSINKLKALKLLFLTDRCMLRKYATSLTGDRYLAMKHGPVASKAKNLIEMDMTWLGRSEFDYAKDFLCPITNGVSAIDDGAYGVFSKLDKQALELIWSEYGTMREFSLVEYTHKFPEWTIHEKRIQNERSVPMDLSDFFLPAPASVKELVPLSKEEAMECIEILEYSSEEAKQFAKLFRIVS